MNEQLMNLMDLTEVFLMFLPIFVTLAFFALVLMHAVYSFFNNYVLRKSPQLNNCPCCGYLNIGTNEKTGEWYGSFEVKDNIYSRKCRCGFEVKIDTDKCSTKKKIHKQISSALSEYEKKVEAQTTN